MGLLRARVGWRGASPNFVIFLKATALLRLVLGGSRYCWQERFLATVKELQHKLGTVLGAMQQANEAPNLRAEKARLELEALEAMSYELDAKFDGAQEAQRQAAEAAKSCLAKMKEELASAKAETAAIRAELDDVRETQRKVEDDAKNKLESAFGEVSDMKEKCGFFMQALKNEKQAGTDLRISAVKKVREELNSTRERVSELEAELLKSKSGPSAYGAAED